MHGVKRVLAFCCLVCFVPTVLIICPLYLKHEVFKDIIYHVAESDVLEIRQGISSIFCQEHVLKMNSSFNAFQLNKMPIESKARKHIRLKKSMILPDDTLEYWGFYLGQGSTVELKVCSLLEGSRILVVKGERNLRTCGLLEHNKNKFGVSYNSEKSQVKVTFETAAEIVDDINIIAKEENTHLASEEKLSEIDDESMFNNAAEEIDDDAIKQKKRNYVSSNYFKKDKNSIQNVDEDLKDRISLSDALNDENRIKSHAKRHFNLHNNKKTKQRQSNNFKNNSNVRTKRDTILDRGINHGGNAQNYRPKNQSDSISSFENSLLECFDGNILLAKYFPPAKNCNNVKYLEQGAHLVSTHNVSTNGYYYYIFFSDNDDAFNHIHAVFDIFKTTYLYSNISKTKECINSTYCSFNVQFLSNEKVIVEINTYDGIEHEDEVYLLTSQCIPRMGVYMIFPILVILFILGCAFL